MFFISHSLSFSVIHVSVDFNIWSKKGLGIVVIFSGGLAIYCQNVRVFERNINLDS